MAKSVGLSLDFVPSSVLVKSDINLLARILRNFLSNAIRYTESGRVLLGCRRHAGFISIEVWDTGIGVPKDKQEEIFQEFKRGDGQRLKQDRGLGLGLAIVDKITRILGHRVRVSSQPGKGSMFAVEVPLAQAHELQRLPEAQVSFCDLDRLAGARIWVLDNDLAICQAMRTLLEGWGCLVSTGLSEEDLAEQVGSFQAEADLLIVDYHLDNEANGVDVAVKINQQRRTPLPTLMITANYSNELKQQMRTLGHTMMHKPIKPMRLKTAINHLLDQSH